MFTVEKVELSKQLAYRAHQLGPNGPQFRKFTGEPYFNHPEQVYRKVTEWAMEKAISLSNFEYRLQSVAYLHDVKEDCPWITDQEIIDASDKRCLSDINNLTNPSKNSIEKRSVRKKMDRDHLKKASYTAKIIKLCDRICNLRDLQKSCPDKHFLTLYAFESQLLLECLKDTDPILETELSEIIEEIMYSIEEIMYSKE